MSAIGESSENMVQESDRPTLNQFESYTPFNVDDKIIAQIRALQQQSAKMDSQVFASLAPEQKEKNEIFQIVKPIVQRANIEALKLSLKSSQEPLTSSQLTTLEKYENVIGNAVSNGWLTMTEVNAHPEAQKLLRKEVVAKRVIDRAKELISQINTSFPETNLKNKNKLLGVKSQLEALLLDSANHLDIRSEVTIVLHLIDSKISDLKMNEIRSTEAQEERASIFDGILQLAA